MKKYVKANTEPDWHNHELSSIIENWMYSSKYSDYMQGIRYIGDNFIRFEVDFQYIGLQIEYRFDRNRNYSKIGINEIYSNSYPFLVIDDALEKRLSYMKSELDDLLLSEVK